MLTAVQNTVKERRVHNAIFRFPTTITWPAQIPMDAILRGIVFQSERRISFLSTSTSSSPHRIRIGPYLQLRDTFAIMNERTNSLLWLIPYI